jgi:phage terminase large subunit
MSQLKIKGTRILDEMLVTDKRFILNVGGSRSSKTFSIMQYILIYCIKNHDKVISIARKTFPSLRLGAYREFIEMLKFYGIYKSENHNKTNNFYILNGNTIQFISIDQSQKLRGLKHDLVFIDECNEISKEESDQIFMRTSGQIILAQNPSDALHWSLQLKDKSNCHYINSTYKDNSFLPEEIVRQIESYKDSDEDMWRVFGLGLPSKNNELVYNTWFTWKDEDELFVDTEEGKQPLFEEIIWGIDWGYNHPTALVKIWIDSNYKRIWCKEIIHESFLTTDDLITKMNQLEVSKEERMWGDSAEPKTIESLRRAGYNIKSSNKEVKNGIDCVKSYKLFIHENSTKLLNELRRYKWKMNGEIKTDEPIKLFDDGLCAIRYAVWTWTEKGKKLNEYDFDVEWI